MFNSPKWLEHESSTLAATCKAGVRKSAIPIITAFAAFDRRVPFALLVSARYEEMAAAPLRAPTLRHTLPVVTFHAQAVGLVRRTLVEGATGLQRFWLQLDALIDQFAAALPPGKSVTGERFAAECSLAGFRRRVAMAGLPHLPRARLQGKLDRLALDLQAGDADGTVATSYMTHLAEAESELLGWQEPEAQGQEDRLFRAVESAFTLASPAGRQIAIGSNLWPLWNAWEDGRPLNAARLESLEMLLSSADAEVDVFKVLQLRYEGLECRLLAVAPEPGPADVANALLDHILDTLASCSAGNTPLKSGREKIELFAAQAEAVLLGCTLCEDMPAAAHLDMAIAEASWPLDEMPEFMRQGIELALSDLGSAACAPTSAGAIADFRNTLARWGGLVAAMVAARTPDARSRDLLDSLDARFGAARQAAPMVGAATDIIERLAALQTTVNAGSTSMDTFRVVCEAALPRLEALTAWSLQLREPEGVYAP